MSDQFLAGSFATMAFMVALVALRVMFGPGRPRADRPLWHPYSRAEAATYYAVTAVSFAVVCAGNLTGAGLVSGGGALLMLVVVIVANCRLLVLHRSARATSPASTRTETATGAAGQGHACPDVFAGGEVRRRSVRRRGPRGGGLPSRAGGR